MHSGKRMIQSRSTPRSISVPGDIAAREDAAKQVEAAVAPAIQNYSLDMLESVLRIVQRPHDGGSKNGSSASNDMLLLVVFALGCRVWGPGDFTAVDALRVRATLPTPRAIHRASGARIHYLGQGIGTSDVSSTGSAQIATSPRTARAVDGRVSAVNSDGPSLLRLFPALPRCNRPNSEQAADRRGVLPPLACSVRSSSGTPLGANCSLRRA